MFFKIAIRNLFRNKRRTVLTGMTMLGAYVFSAMTMGIEDGTYGFVIDQFTRGGSGHLQMMAPGYLKHPSLAKTIFHPEEVVTKIKLSLKDRLEGITARIESEGLLVQNKNVIGTKIVGIDQTAEAKTTHFMNQIHFDNEEQKKWPENGIVLTEDLVQKLNLKSGNELVLISQGFDGSIANDKFIFVGHINDGLSTVYLNYASAQNFFSSNGQATRLVAVLKDVDNTENAVKALRKDFPSFSVEPWYVVEDEFYRAMQSDQSAVFMTLGIFLFLAAFGILNTVLMNLLERTKEFGVMRILGTKQKHLITIIVLEQFILSVAMSLVGAVIATGLNWYLSNHGIPYPKPIEIGGMTLKALYGNLSFKNVYYPFLIVVCSAVVVSFIPAIRAARLSIIKAMGER